MGWGRRMEKAVIFDMDGTLFRTEQILEGALEVTFNRLRNRGQWDGETPLEQYRRIMGVPLPVVWETLLPAHDEVIRQDADQFFLNALIEQIQNGNGALYEGVVPLFERLTADGHLVLIASNGLVPYLEAIVTHYGLQRWVKQTYSIEHIETLHKSDLVARIVAEHAVTAGVVVGDRLSDIEAAQANGLRAIGCRFTFSQEDELRRADAIVNHLDEVGPLVAAYLSP